MCSAPGVCESPSGTTFPSAVAAPSELTEAARVIAGIFLLARPPPSEPNSSFQAEYRRCSCAAVLGCVCVSASERSSAVTGLSSAPDACIS
eukprot:CAMPEP_0115843010 /NCGR_PEP_ID=MMETSP0287-20121206/8093_1 /TAXON_ID=412157 /ORGANISM="Chrysochromulina rotalis, Strain UIO044" /LENGTH=90 /DNA_ID=CAMNT_0003296693 /DNA_START=438 /DNA_END=707 /DNA_ORIENTATION=-